LINNLYQNPQNETIPQHHVKLPILVQWSTNAKFTFLSRSAILKLMPLKLAKGVKTCVRINHIKYYKVYNDNIRLFNINIITL
jgi:hypothetical protein